MIDDADLVIDGTDNFETRYLLNDVCVKKNKPWIYGGCVSSYGLVLPILPMSSRCALGARHLAFGHRSFLVRSVQYE